MPPTNNPLLCLTVFGDGSINVGPKQGVPGERYISPVSQPSTDRRRFSLRSCPDTVDAYVQPTGPYIFPLF